MVLYVIRHGKAEAVSVTGRDRDRVLRPKGHRQAEHLGRELDAAERRPSLVITSTYKRAYETADRINSALGVEFISDTRLCVDEPVSLVIDLISEHAGRGSLCIVGHNPQLEYLCGALSGGPAGVPVRVRTGEAFAFELDADDPLGGSRLLASMRLGDAPD